MQVAAVKTSSASPTECLADDGSGGGAASETVAYFGDIARNLKSAFPNIKLVYFVTRSYGGYALTGLMPEPFAFEQGFAVRWIVDAQIRGSNEYGDLTFEGPDAPAPWLSYGPLLWANGETPNGQGLSWSPEDYREDDRTHPSGSGSIVAGDLDGDGDTDLVVAGAQTSTPVNVFLNQGGGVFGAPSQPESHVAYDGALGDFDGDCSGLPSGAYRGDESSCDADACTGGCCLEPLPECQVMSLADCTAAGGTFLGIGASCTIETCPAAFISACCLQTEACCDVVTEGDCAVIGGTWHGLGVECSACLPDLFACCLPNGSCTLLEPLGCIDAGGTFEGCASCEDLDCPGG